MAVIGIESSAHTFGVGIVDDGKIISNFRSMYKISDRGLVPSKVADFHVENAGATINKALRSCDLYIDDIEAVGYTKGPGIGSCLRIGQIAARSLSLAHHIPIYPVNHAVAHVEITQHLSGAKDPLALYVSGGNSQIIGLDDMPFRHYRVYGETFDIGIGNMLDVFARSAGLKPAWGSTVAKAAMHGHYIKMPYTVKGMDFTFTGLLTHAIKMLKHNRLEDVAFSVQDTAFAMLSEAIERAMLLSGKGDLLLCGGVAQSTRLRQMLEGMTESHRIRLHVAPDEFNADNGAMIALVAEKMFDSGRTYTMSDAGTDQHYRIDKVEITW